MALIRAGALVSEIRGSVGGTVFSRNRGGAIARNRTNPINPNTLAQAQNRTLFATIVGMWSAMAAKGTVDAWNTFAQTVELVNRLGEPYTPSGRQAFMMANLALSQADLALITDPPASPNVPDPVASFSVLSETDDEETLETLTIDFPVTMTGSYALIDATPPMAPGVTNVTNRYRRIATPTVDTGGLSLLTEYAQAYPDAVAPVGHVIYFRIRTTGNTNPFLSAYSYAASIIVAATP